MNRFTRLYTRLDGTTRTLEKVAALKDYFRQANPADAAWAIYFLSGRRIKRLVKTGLLREWAAAEAGVPAWLFAECYDRVGDLAETIALILPPVDESLEIPLAELIEHRLLPLRNEDEDDQRTRVLKLWREFAAHSRFVLGKLMTGGFRVGVSQALVLRALSESTGIDKSVLAHRMIGNWEPTAEFYRQLVDPDTDDELNMRPYPFFLAHPLKETPEELGPVEDWQAEWKWDGIRAQLIRREGESHIWSRGEELITEQFPEVVTAATSLPDGTVCDGELLGWDIEANRPLDFSQLQRRLGRKRLGKKLLTEVPVAMLVFDLLEINGRDIRDQTWMERQAALDRLLPARVSSAAGDLPLGAGQPSPLLRRPPPVIDDGRPISWKALAAARQQSRQWKTEGLMLKRKASPYRVGRPVGDWWKWKVDPYTVDAVLVYAQRGHGRRANLYTDYTFAVWSEGELVTFAKAYSGLTDRELREVDAFVRRNTREKFGPVRSVTPELVFELAFENIQRSKRHKSGIAVRFPRIQRWRKDKSPDDADSLETIVGMLAESTPT